MAAPFFGSAGSCQGSLVYTSPVSRIQNVDVAQIGEAVAAEARNLSARLGFEPES